MKQFALKITTLSPFSIRSDHSPTSAGVASYIPGSTLLGCLASAHQMLRSNEDEFVDLFLSDKVQYPNLYPASFKNKDMRTTNAPLYCIPRTAQSCKRFKGFLPIKGDNPNDDDKAHGVRDSLFDWALFALLYKDDTKEAEREQIIAPLEEIAKDTCTCGEPLDSFDGFYRWGDGGTRALAKAETRLLTRTGINRKYGTVEEQILYSRKVYEEGTSFFGVLRTEDDVADALRKFILDKGSNEYGPLLLTQFARLGTA